MQNTNYPLVTIGIPTYNRADSYLQQAIESALSQTYQNIEIVISDNCSQDKTDEVVKSYADQRLKYFRQKVNIGPNNNFNFCLEQATGKYFLLLHSDDIIDVDFVAICMEAANYRTDMGIIRTGTRVINAENEILSEHPNMVAGLSTENFIRAWFDCKTSLYLCSTLFNTKRLREIGGFRSKHNLFQDVMAEIQLAASYGRVDVEKIKASFRKHPEEITFSVKIGSWCEDSLILLDLICNLVGENTSRLRREGERFLSRLNYNTASKIASPFKRLIAYIIVFKSYNFKYLPPSVYRRLHCGYSKESNT